MNVDTYTVPDAELARRGVHRLPRTLGEAVDAFEADDLARETFGPEFHASLRASSSGANGRRTSP